MSVKRFAGLTWTLSALLLSACPADSNAPAATADGAVPDSAETLDAGAPPVATDAGAKDAASGEARDAAIPQDSGQAHAPSEPPPPAQPADAGTPAAGSGKPEAQHFFLPTPEPENTTAPKIVIDREGGTHAIYPGYAGGDAYYAYCPKNCTGTEAFKVVRLRTDGTAGNAMLRLTAAGKPRVLLSTFQRVYYAQCDDGCTQEANWQNSVIVEHGSDKDVSGNAFALDPQGRPRFIMHAYLAYLGVGQKTPQTWYAQCDAGCNDATHWRTDLIQDDIWYDSQLQFDASGRAHLATGVVTMDPNKATYKLAAYFVCEKDCTSSAAWSGIGLAHMFENQVEEIRPSLTMALTKAGQPRVLALAEDEAGKRKLLYFECDQACAEDHWNATLLSSHDKLGSGLDMVLDDKDRPRFVFTLDSNIGLHYCEADHCTADNSPWDLTKVEYAGEVPADHIILYPNCSIDAWLLHDPSLALLPDGSVRVGYQATDISGGVTTVDPSQPRCVAGKDMTLSRMTVLKAYK